MILSRRRLSGITMIISILFMVIALVGTTGSVGRCSPGRTRTVSRRNIQNVAEFQTGTAESGCSMVTCTFTGTTKLSEMTLLMLSENYDERKETLRRKSAITGNFRRKLLTIYRSGAAERQPASTTAPSTIFRI